MFRLRHALILLLATPATVLAQSGRAQVNRDSFHDASPPLREMPPGPRHVGSLEAEPARRVPSSRIPSFGPDPVLQAPATGPDAPLAPATVMNIDGIGNGVSGPAGTFFVNAAPPDTNAAVGPNHIVETVNTDLAVFNKTSGAMVFGPLPINTLWSGFGGGCQVDNDGDPIVTYDRIADRWIISQFQVRTVPFQQCVAVSQTADPTGAYFRYAFNYSGFPDYPKMGVWPDAYYVTYNMFNNAGTSFLGGQVCAFDRARMLTGAAATQQCFSTSFGGLLPADVDGANPPPAGAPNPIVALGASSTTLAYWRFHVDWTTPANSTLAGPTSLTVPAYTEACSGCIIQSGGGSLDSLSDRLMYRAAYRTFADGHHALVTNHAVTVGTTVGVRWYELRVDDANNLSLFQSGTYAPDAAFRWMGSIAMDQSGDMALGFSTSSSTTKPSIRYTGRLAGDAAGTMAQGEETIVTGAGAQGDTLSRWGDYSSMQIDPVDDCTFWYANEYIPSDGTFNWKTRIASFKFPACGTTGGNDFSIAANPPSLTVVQGNSATSTISTTLTSGAVQSVALSVTGVPAGATASFSVSPVTVGNSSILTFGAGSAAPGAYTLTITGLAVSGSHSTPVSVTVALPPGTVSGHVRDASTNVAIANATVVANPGGFSTTTDQSGFYTLTVAPGAYSVSGSAAGYNTVSVSGVVVSSGATTTRDLALPGVPTLTVSSARVTAGSSVTVTLTNGLGGATDWLAFAAKGSSDTSYIPPFVYVGSGVTTRTWTVTPTTVGTFEFRLFANDGYTRLATSPPVKVVANDPGPFLYVVGRPTSSSAIQVVSVISTVTNHLVDTIPAGVDCYCISSDGLAISPDGSRAYVANELGNSLSVIDTALGAVIATVPTGNGPTAVKANAAGTRVYVLNGTSPTSVVVLDAATNAVLATIPLGVVQARGMALRADGQRIYVSTYGSNTVLVVDTTINSIVGTIAVGNLPVGVDVTRDGSRVYVANLLGGTVSVINTATNAIAATVPVGTYPISARLTPDGRRAYVSNEASGIVSVIDTQSNTVVATINVGLPNDVAFSSDGSRAYVTSQSSIRIVDIPTSTVTATIPFDSANNGVAWLIAIAPTVNPTPTIATLSPASIAAGSASFPLTVTGTGFVSGAVVQVNGAARTTTVSDGTHVTATLLAADVATQGGNPTITVGNPPACVNGACTSNGIVLTVGPPNPAPTLTTISPTSVTAGGAAFPLTATGTGFVGNSVVQVDGAVRATTVVDAAHLTAQLTAADRASGGTHAITVMTPTPGGGTSSAQTLTVVGPTLTVSATTVPLAGPVQVAFSNGPGQSSEWVGLFPTSTTGTGGYVDWQWTTGGQGGAGAAASGTLPFPTGGRPVTAGTYVFRWISASSTVLAQSPVVAFQVINPTPTIATLSPASIAAGSASFPLTVTGTGFVTGAVVQVNGALRTTTVSDGTHVTATLLAADVATQGGNPTITVGNPPACVNGACTSNGIVLTVGPPNPVPTLTAISPASVTAGGAAFPLTATGTGFVGNSVVQVDGAVRATTVVDAAHLTAQLTAADRASGGTHAITVMTPTPGGGTSSAQTLTVVGPTLTVSATTVPLAGPVQVAFSNGPGQSSEWVGLFPTSTTGTGGYVDWQWTTGGQGGAGAAASGTLAFPTGGRPVTAGTYVFRWISASSTVLAQSPVVAFQVINPTPTIATLSPASIAAGSASFPLTVTGTGFVTGATVQVNGALRTTTVSDGTHVTATLLAADVATQGGNPTITVGNPPACVNGACTSNGVVLTVGPPNPVPTLTAISPTSVTAGGAAFPLTVTGTGFVGNSVVQVDGAVRATTVVDAAHLTAQLTAADRASGGTHVITVMTPTPGGGTSSAQTLTVVGPTLTVSATTVPLAGPVQATFSNGPGQSSEWVGLFPTSTTGTGGYVDWQWTTGGQGGAGAAASGTLPFPTGGRPVAVGTYVFRWISASSTVLAQSPVVAFQVINPTPTIATLSPASIAAGSASFPLTVTGTGFVTGAVVQVNGALRTTTVSDGTHVTATLLAADVATQGGNPTITVGNPPACVNGACTSNGIVLTVGPPNPVPTLTAISPASVTAGGAAFPLTATGTGFVGNSVVQVDGAVRATTVVDAAHLTAQLTAADRASGGTHAITVMTPTPGGGTSSAQTLTVVGPTLTVSATTVPLAGPVQVAFSNGPGQSSEWVGLFPTSTTGTGGYVDWQWTTGGQGGAGAAASGTLAFPTGGRPVTAGTYVFRWISASSTVLAQSPVVAFQVINPTPTIATLSPASIAAGSASFPLTVTGTGFVTGATVQVNGALRTTTVSDGTHVTATLLAADVATQGGNPTITVGNPPACVNGACTSNGVVLTVGPPNPVPTLTAISPTSVTAGGAAFPLTVTGTGFVGNSVVQVDSAVRATTVVDAAHLTAQLTAADRASGGTHAITVVTPAPGGGTSGAQTLTIVGPQITAGSPTVAPGGTMTFVVMNGPGNQLDWVGLVCPATGSDAAFVDWKYLTNTRTPPSGGLTAATITFAMPSGLGLGDTCNTRLFANDGFMLLAKSSTVTVGGNMTYHGGPVQRAQKVYTIFWNPPGTPVFPAGYQATINQFVQDLNGSSYYGIASQYSDTTGNIGTAVAYGGTWLDTTNAIPNDPPTTGDLLNEVNRAKAANAWTSDANSYFQVYTPSGFGTAAPYCGFHVTNSIPAFGEVLFPADRPTLGATCFLGGAYPNSPILDTAITVSAHEIMETATDPQGSGWYYVNGAGEIGDLCAYHFGSQAVDGSNLIVNGHRYLVQQEWSNAISGCALAPALTRPVSVTITTVGAQHTNLSDKAGEPDTPTSAAGATVGETGASVRPTAPRGITAADPGKPDASGVRIR